MTDKYNVLFLCTANSARSILAEAILNRIGETKFQAYSAGSEPKGTIHPFALKFLDNLHFDTSSFASKSWFEFAKVGAPKMDFVFTVCDSAAKEICPTWPGQPMSSHWGIPDPASASGTDAVKMHAFSEAYRMLEQRISIFINLPIISLDKLSLQHSLDDIGRS